MWIRPEFDPQHSITVLYTVYSVHILVQYSIVIVLGLLAVATEWLLSTVLLSSLVIIAIFRFAMCHPTRCHGVVAINCSATTSLGRFLDKLRVIHKKYKDKASIRRRIEKQVHNLI